MEEASPYGSIAGDLTTFNKPISQTSTIDVHPMVAVRNDGIAMVAYEDRGPRPTGSQIVLFIDTPQGPCRFLQLAL